MTGNGETLAACRPRRDDGPATLTYYYISSQSLSCVPPRCMPHMAAARQSCALPGVGQGESRGQPSGRVAAVGGIARGSV